MTVINVFTVAPEEQARFVALLTRATGDGGLRAGSIVARCLTKLAEVPLH